jgi:alpha-D-xyloside xylohydrolase
MKFTDGYWLMRPGVNALYPAHLYDSEVKSNELWLYMPSRPMTRRGDDFDMPLLTVALSSPMADVVRVRIIHHRGTPVPEPHFEINADPDTKVDFEESAEAIGFRSGRLRVSVPRGGEWRMDFLGDGKPLTNSGLKGMAYISMDSGETYVKEQLQLGVGELVYGLGERFSHFVKNGQSVDTWNEDGGTRSEQAYKNVSFYMTNRGYGVFVNHPERVSFEVGSENVQRVQFSVAGEQLDYFLIYGPTPKEILQRYTALTGRPALPPAWSFGLWLSTSGTTDYDEGIVQNLVQRMAEQELPLSVFHFDPYWMKDFHWTNFEWDTNIFPNPKAMLKRLRDRGLKICLWINPYIAQRSALFDEGMEAGYLVKRTDGSVWQWDRWQAGMALVDFTNPKARAWITAKLQPLFEMGVDALKTDFGERIPSEGVVYFDGSDPQRMHNYYTYLYNRTVFEALEKYHGKGQAIVFARSSTAGGQQFPVHWGGDNTATYESMAESLRGGLSLAQCGFGFWSHDIGGYDQTATPDVYKRWCAFGLLSSHSRLHGSTTYRVPWAFDEESVDVLRHFTKLKNSLMPYLYQTARQAHLQGTPVLRPMMLEFPEDPACETLDRQYMLGDSLLVAPVFSADGNVSYYVPAGRWTHLLNSEVIEGPGWRQETHDFMSLPLLVRQGTVLAYGGEDQRPDYDYTDDLVLRVYQLRDGKQRTVEIPDLAGKTAATFVVSRSGQEISVQRKGAASTKKWQIELIGYRPPTVAKGGTIKPGLKSALVTANKSVKQVVVTLHGEDK